MKKFTIVLDGIADRAQEKLGGKTPMEAAKTPALDKLFLQSKPGVVLTIPKGLETGSAVANMSLLGYDPENVYTGRAVIEAAGAGIPVSQQDLYIRCNFVTLEGNSFDNSIMQSYSAHDIETEKSRPLVQRLNQELFTAPFELINTDTFRNILVVKDAAHIAKDLAFMPPHDIIGEPVKEYTNRGGVIGDYFDLLRKAYDVLKAQNNTNANAIWFWGASYAPDFGEQGNKSRVILAETSLMRGIAALSKTDCVTTSEQGSFVDYLKRKKEDAVSAVKKYDYAYIHIQKLDDLSHELLPVEKTEAIELIDEYFIKPFFDELKEPFSGIIVSDHYTFSDSGGHDGEPAPFMLLGHGGSADGRFTEQFCRGSQISITAPQLVALQSGEKQEDM